MIVWRISRYADLNGLGGLRWPGRWHPAGQPIVYLADHPASAMLEALVHLEVSILPATFTLLQVELPDRLVQTLDQASLPEDWTLQPALTQSLGHHWLQRQASAALQVPSAVAPNAHNYLLNPLHPDAGVCRILSVRDVPWDVRLRS
ncbi:hypothetical protein VK98_01145 [Chromobacterium sp. LK11]|uniref:RES family NAD+ phosphorylase n=1 Tax=Chromobacterium sp. LK11 TaxID=1628212 RepID=UPI000653C492|nr:RES family NAD+ phosphorylase [Chromobacterium sp. LK11]KMN83793.1 hypothetical protein VK98_01145 [Chromobacterium sp. LK11]